MKIHFWYVIHQKWFEVACTWLKCDLTLLACYTYNAVNKLVTVNFKENDIIILYQGQKNTGGYSIDVVSIHWEKDILWVKKNETIPEAGKPVTMAITNPYCITIIPKAKSIIIEEMDLI